MERYDRGELAVCKASFYAVDGSGTQPDSATLRCAYTDTNNVAQLVSSSMVYDSVNKVWTGTFDTNLCKGGTYVDWVVKSLAGLQGAEQGQFYVVANRANT